MDPIIIIMIAWAILSMVAMPLLMRRPSQKKRYQNMSDRDLVACNTQAKIMKRRLRFATYLGPLPIVFIMAVLPKHGDLQTSLLGLMVFMIPGGLSGAWFFRAIEDLTTSEMDFRKFKQDTEPPNQAMHQRQ